MLKRLLLLLVLSQTGRAAMANKVDRLKTDSDVVKFITSLDKQFQQKYAPKLLIKPSRDLTREIAIGDIKDWKIKNWEKIDLNGDGRDDLVVNAHWNNNTVFIAVDQGNDAFKLFNLDYSIFGEFEVAKVIRLKRSPLILFHFLRYTPENENQDINTKQVATIDTLVYKYNSFIDFNNSPLALTIESIKFETRPTFGFADIFSIEIKNTGNASYINNGFDKNKGSFSTKIDSMHLKAIHDVLNYINTQKTKNYYAVGWTDDSTCFLTIKFADGSIKKIKDYGERGTFGLRKLYSLFFDLRDNQNWTKQ